MNLLLLSIEFPPGPGGMGTHAYQLAYHLTRLGWKVTVATPQNFVTQAEAERFNRQQPFRVVSFAYRGPILLESASRLIQTLRAMQGNTPDVILAVGRQAVWLGTVLSLLTGRPLAAAGAGTEFLVSGVERWLTQWCYRRVRLFLPNSQFTANLAAAQGYTLHKTKIIPLGADGEAYRPGLPTEGLRSRLNLGGKRVLLTVGQVYERKGQDVVIRALPRVLERCPEVVYVMVGLPTLRAQMEALARELGVEEHVLFAGAVDQAELPLYYNLADLFVLVSRRTQDGSVEGFGIVAVEAALCGVPAVVSGGSGLTEAVLPGETGLVVEPDDPQGTAEAILTLLTDRELHRRMSAAAHAYARQHATWEKRMAEYDAVLKDLARRG